MSRYVFVIWPTLSEHSTAEGKKDTERRNVTKRLLANGFMKQNLIKMEVDFRIMSLCVSKKQLLWSSTAYTSMICAELHYTALESQCDPTTTGQLNRDLYAVKNKSLLAAWSSLRVNSLIFIPTHKYCSGLDLQTPSRSLIGTRETRLQGVHFSFMKNYYKYYIVNLI